VADPFACPVQRGGGAWVPSVLVFGGMGQA